MRQNVSSHCIKIFLKSQRSKFWGHFGELECTPQPKVLTVQLCSHYFDCESCLIARTLICVGVCDCVCEKLIVHIFMQYKAAGGGEANLAHAPSRWFELSTVFINDDESPFHFTSNQRALRGTQIWSPLTKWFSWPTLCQPAIELATWWYGCC